MSDLIEGEAETGIRRRSREREIEREREGDDQGVEKP